MLALCKLNLGSKLLHETLVWSFASTFSKPSSRQEVNPLLADTFWFVESALED
jgi:hypothetical protein